MSAMATQTRAALPDNAADFWTAITTWLRRNTKDAAISAMTGAIVGYAVNVYLMLVTYDGYVVHGGFATSQGNFLSGALIWTLGSTIVFSLIGYRRAVGKERFWRDIQAFPATIESLFRRDGEMARIHLLWGATVSFLAMQFISPSLGVVIAAGLLSALPSVLGQILSTLLLRLWSTLAQSLAPAKGKPLVGPMTMIVGVMGACAALAVGFFITGSLMKLVLAFGCGAAAWALANRDGSAPKICLVFLIGALLWQWLRALLYPSMAMADDGGLWENGGNLISWWNSGQAGPLLTWAGGGGLAGAVGSAIGTAIGNIFGGGGDGWGEEQPEPTIARKPPSPPVVDAAVPTEAAEPPSQAVETDERDWATPEDSVTGADDSESDGEPADADDKDDFSEFPDDAPLTRSAATDDAEDYPEADEPSDFPATDDLGEGDDSDGDGEDARLADDDAGAGDDEEEPEEPDRAPEPEGPTPEEIEAANQRKRDRLHDIIKSLAGMEDIDKRNRLIGIVRNAAQVDDKGIPQGDLDRIATMVHNQMHPDEPLGTMGEIVEQTKDFVKGVGEDVRDLGAAGADLVKGAARDIKDLATDPEFSKDFWDGTHDTVTKGANAIDKGVKAGVQFGKDLARDIKDLATDQEFANDFWDSANQNLDKATDKIKKVAGEAVEIGKDVLNDPSILGETLGGTLDDLQDPDKVADAIRKGVPGGGRLLDAMDKNRPVTERLRDGLLGAAEWAGAADNVADAAELIKGGTRLIGNLGSELGEKLAGLSDDLAGKAVKNADNLIEDAAAAAAPRLGKEAAEDAGSIAGRSSKGIVEEGAIAPGVIDKADEAAAAGRTAREAGDSADDILKAGDDAGSPPSRRPGTPESQTPPPQGATERGTHVRNTLREEGYREDLVNRVGYEPSHASGNKNILGSTRGTGQEAEAAIHSGAFDEGPTSLRSTTKHEVDHILQHGQLETQAAPHGPKADWVDDQGKWTPKGREMAEMEVRMQELDRNLVTRDNAIRRAGANPADKSTWPQEALDADKEVGGARKWLEDHNVGKKTTPDAPAVEPEGDDLYKTRGQKAEPAEPRAAEPQEPDTRRSADREQPERKVEEKPTEEPQKDSGPAAEEQSQRARQGREVQTPSGGTVRDPGKEGLRPDEDVWVGMQQRDAFEWNDQNIQKMLNGEAPIGRDNKPMALHHRAQQPNGPIDEYSASLHQQQSRLLHDKDYSMIDRPEFDDYRQRYWRERARCYLENRKFPPDTWGGNK
jgi:hypothetical protein